MRAKYRKIEDVLSSPLAQNVPAAKPEQTDRVLRSSRLEDSIYRDLKAGDTSLEQIEQSASEKLHSFPALSRDVYQSFYSLMPRRNDDSVLSATARKFNVPILDHITQSADYPTLKSVCEGRELPSYEAAAEFIRDTAGNLDTLLAGIGGEKNALNTLEKLENAEVQAQDRLAELLERMQKCKVRDKDLEQSVVDAANIAESKQRQVAAVSKMIDTNAAKNDNSISAIIDMAVTAAADKAEEVRISFLPGAMIPVT